MKHQDQLPNSSTIYNINFKNLVDFKNFKKDNISGHSPFLRLTCCPQREFSYIFTEVICMLQVCHIKPRMDKTINFVHPKAFLFRRVSLVRETLRTV